MSARRGAIVVPTSILDRRGFRAVIAERPSRRARRGVRAGRRSRRGAEFCWSSIRRRHHQLHGLPIFCSGSRSRSTGCPRSARSAIRRRELFNAERGQGAWLNASRSSPSASTLIDSPPCRIYSVHRHRPTWSDCSAISKVSRAVRCPGRRRSTVLRRGRLSRRLPEQQLNPWDLSAGVPRHGGGRPALDMSGGRSAPRAGQVLATNGPIRQMVETVRDFQIILIRLKPDAPPQPNRPIAHELTQVTSARQRLRGPSPLTGPGTEIRQNGPSIDEVVLSSAREKYRSRSAGSEPVCRGGADERVSYDETVWLQGVHGAGSRGAAIRARHLPSDHRASGSDTHQVAGPPRILAIRGIESRAPAT